MTKIRTYKIDNSDNIQNDLLNTPPKNTILHFIKDDYKKPVKISNYRINTERLKLSIQKFNTTTHLSKKQINTNYTIYSL